MLAMPMVDLPAPDSPINPSTCPAVQLDVHPLDDFLPAFFLEPLDPQALHRE